MPTSQGSDECKASASTCPCCNPCPKDTFKVELLSVQADKDLSQMSSLTEIYPGTPFAIRVTPYVDDVMAVVESCTGTTLTLNDATEFLTSGQGMIATECVPICFSWADKSGNTLTGVSPTLSGVVKGMKVRCQSHKTPWENYPGTSPLQVQAWACKTDGTRVPVPLDGERLDSCWWYCWKTAFWTFQTNQVLHNPCGTDVDLWITVTERAVPATGRTGAARVTLKAGTRKLRVVPSSYNIRGTTQTALAIENYIEESQYVDPFYARDPVGVTLGAEPGTISAGSIGSWRGGRVLATGVSITRPAGPGPVILSAKAGSNSADPYGTETVYVGGTETWRPAEASVALWQRRYNQYTKLPCSWDDAQYYVYDQFKIQDTNWGDSVPTAAQHVANYRESLFYANMTGGYLRFVMGLWPTGTIQACFLRCPAGAYIYRGEDTSPRILWSPYAHWYNFKVTLTNTEPVQGTGAQLRTAVGQGPYTTETFARVNAGKIANNVPLNDTVSSTSIEIPIDPAIITPLLNSNILYALFFIEGKSVPFSYYDYESGGDNNNPPHHIAFMGCAGNPVMPQLVLIT